MKNLFLMLVLSLFTFVGMAQSEEPILKIGVISDLHNQQSLISGDVESVQLRGTVNTVLNRIKTEEELDVLVLNGDFTSDVTISKENWERVRELIINATRNVFPEGANTPVLYVNGNHEYEVANFDNIPKPYNAGDFYTTPMKSDIGELAASDCFYEEADNGTSGTMSLLAAYHYVIDGFDFVVLNTGKHFFQYAWDYQYSLESVQWVANKLEEIYREDSDKPVFFFAHLPFADSNSISSASKGLKDCEATRLLKTTLAQYPKLIYIYGHDHGGNNAYIRTETAQRVTQYDRNGNLYTGATTGTTTSVTNLYFKNSATSLYLGRTATSDNIQTFSEKKAATVTPSSTTTGMYNIVLGNEDEENNLYIGSNGRFSGNRETTDLWIYEVTSTENGTTSATKFTGNALENGKSYLFVGEKNSAYYACTNEIYSSGTGARLVGASVTLSGDNLTYVDSNLTDDYTAIWVAEIEETTTTTNNASFISAFAGSMRYYNSIAASGSTVEDSRIAQALMVYVYEDRIELQMRNYAETGVIEGVTIAETPTPYVIYRTATPPSGGDTPTTPTTEKLAGTPSYGGGMTTPDTRYPLSNIVDGDHSTKYWAPAQAVGQYVQLDLGAEKTIGEIKLYLATDGDLPGGAVVEYSTDNTSWTTVAEFTKDDVPSDCIYVCDAEGATARYVRMRITATNGGRWFQMYEFEVYKGESATPIPSRTISVSSADETMGSAYIGTAGTTTVTQEGRITITAVANEGFTFVNWTVNGTEVSTNAEYTDETEGDKAYVANFCETPTPGSVEYPRLTHIYKTPSTQQENRFLDRVTYTAREETKEIFNLNLGKEVLSEFPAGINIENGGNAMISYLEPAMEISKDDTSFDLTCYSTHYNIQVGSTLYKNNMSWVNQAVYIDWNVDGDFNDENEAYDPTDIEGSSSSTNPPVHVFRLDAGYTRNITIPAGVPAGSYRMYVVYGEPNEDPTYNWSFEELFTTNQIYAGNAYEFTVKINGSASSIEKIKETQARAYMVNNTLFVSGLSDKAVIYVYDIVGRNLASTTAIGEEAMLELPATNQGIYLVKIVCNGKTQTIKIAK